MSEFLAEARVLVRPDTSKFRVELQRELLAATRGLTIPIPVAAASAAGTSALVSQQLALGATTEKTASATNALARAQILADTASRKLAVSQEVVQGAASRVAAAQITATRSAIALGAAEKAVEAALATQNVALITTTKNTLELAQAQRLAALSALASARAQSEAGAAALLAARSAFGGAATIGLGAVAVAAIVAGKALKSAIVSAAQFETELNVFRVTARASVSEMEAVSETAQDLGRDLTLPGIAANDAARALTGLVKAGLGIQDAMDGARGTLQLATAAQIDIASAVELSANSLNTFNLAGSQATHVADLLAGASQAAQGDIQTMGIALAQAGAAAALAGVSLEDTIALISLLAKQGLQGSDAGTSLRTAFLALASPTERARKIIEDLNLELEDVSGNLRPEIFAEFFQATENLDRLEQLNLAVKVFGRDAVRALGLIGTQGVAGLEAMRVETNQAGLAAEIAGARTQGLAGSYENLKNQAAAAGLALGNMVKGPLGDIIDFTAGAVQKVNELNQAINDFEQEIQDDSGVDIFGTSLIDMARSSDAFLDNITDATPVLDGFFGRLSGGDKDVIDLASGMDVLTRSSERTAEAIDGLNRSLEALPAVAASASAKLGLDIAAARAAGDTGAELAGLRQREDNLTGLIERLEKKPQTAAIVKTLTENNELLDQTRTQIQSILDERVSDTQAAIGDAEDARNKADQAFLELVAGRQGRAERLIERAEGTDPLKDDIKLRLRFLKILDDLIAQTRATIKDAQTKASTIASLTAEIIQVTNEVKDLRRKQREALRDQQVERLDQAERSIGLDIELADINDNTKKRISLRLQLIAQLKKEARVLKLTGNALKEQRNEIARIRAEIKAIQEEEQGAGKDARKSAAEFFFSQLQAQQGFAANLLGNLIPADQTAGLVGVPSPPSQGIRTESAAAEGRAAGVPTAGQVNSEISILNKILMELRRLNGSYDAPEAITQKKNGGTNMDTQ